ncbi:MAG: flagellar assembly protein FliW [Clostridia bacterium]|jgi:flagellar assembly factor FliW
METDKPMDITFKREIYGFENIKEYTLTKASESADNPFRFLKASDGNVCFILLDPKMIDRSYDPVLDDKEMKSLELKDPADMRIYGIVVIPNDIKMMTINLRSPIIINIENGNAIQLILEDDRYSIRHRILGC